MQLDRVARGVRYPDLDRARALHRAQVVDAALVELVDGGAQILDGHAEVVAGGVDGRAGGRFADQVQLLVADRVPVPRYAGDVGPWLVGQPNTLR